MKAIEVAQAEADRILSGEQTILTSAERPDLETGERVALWVPRPRTHPCDMKGHIFGTGTVDDVLPVVAVDEPWPSKAPHIDGDAEDLTVWEWRPPAVGEDWEEDEDGVPNWFGRDITDQVPFGDFSEGRWGWLLSDPQPLTKQCPTCWGNTWKALDLGWCPNESCRWGRVPADPVPCKGRQGVFELPADIAEAVES